MNQKAHRLRWALFFDCSSELNSDIVNLNKEYVETVTSGSQSFKDVLNTLYALIDSTKINCRSVLVAGVDIFYVSIIDVNNGEYVFNNTAVTNNLYNTTAMIKSTDSTYIIAVGVTVQNASNNTVPSGRTFRLYY